MIKDKLNAFVVSFVNDNLFELIDKKMKNKFHINLEQFVYENLQLQRSSIKEIYSIFDHDFIEAGFLFDNQGVNTKVSIVFY